MQNGAGHMKELVVISGKGGTGKTSLVASFAALAEKKNANRMLNAKKFFLTVFI